jgi:hypothetical protein
VNGFNFDLTQLKHEVASSKFKAELCISLTSHSTIIALKGLLEDHSSLHVVMTTKYFRNEVTEMSILLHFHQKLFATISCGLHPIGGPFLTPIEIKAVGRDVLKAILAAYISLTQNQLRNEWIHSTLDWFTR